MQLLNQVFNCRNHIYFLCFLSFLFTILGFEPRAPSMLGKGSDIELYPQPLTGGF